MFEAHKKRFVIKKMESVFVVKAMEVLDVTSVLPDITTIPIVYRATVLAQEACLRFVT